jgi:hypothetical protein
MPTRGATTPGAGGDWSCGACAGTGGGSAGAGCNADGNRTGGGGAVGRLHLRAIAPGGCSLAGARSASETFDCP